MPERPNRACSLFNWSAAPRSALDLADGRGHSPLPVPTPRRARPVPGHSADGGACWRVAALARDMTHPEHVKRLAVECRRLIRQRDTATLMIDLGDVETADTKLVACLVGVYRLACARAVHVEMILPRVVEDVVSVCRLEQLIEQTRPRHMTVREGRD